jgi:hypothetical protein
MMRWILKTGVKLKEKNKEKVGHGSVADFSKDRFLRLFLDGN